MHALILALHEQDETATQVAQSLQQSGHEVILSKNFSHSITILEKQQVDLIISDVHLENGGDVFDFLKWVRTNPATKDVPFVMFSCRPTRLAKYLEDAIRTTARILGAGMFISMETFDAQEFQKLINALLPAEELHIALKVPD